MNKSRPFPVKNRPPLKEHMRIMVHFFMKYRPFDSIYENEKEYPYHRGERIYLLKEGWGTIERIIRADGELYALVSMENGKHLRFSISKVETISVNDPELLEKVGNLNLLPE